MSAMSANSAVTLMKEAVDAAVKHGDIKLDAVAKAVGMSRQHLREWIDSRTPNPQWDTKLAAWLQRVQSRAIEEQSGGASSSSSSSSSKASASTSNSSAGGASSSSSARPSNHGMAKLKADLLELEDYIPWNAVTATWANRRTLWARKLKECTDAQSVAKHLMQLEAALNSVSFCPEWRDGGVRDEWAEELTKEVRATKVREYVREMEEHLRWKAFALRAQLQDGMKKILGSSAGAALRELDQKARQQGEVQRLKALQARVANLEYKHVEPLISELCELAALTSSTDDVTRSVHEALDSLAGQGPAIDRAPSPIEEEPEEEEEPPPPPPPPPPKPPKPPKAQRETSAQQRGPTQVHRSDSARNDSVRSEGPPAEDDGFSVDMEEQLQEDLREAERGGLKRARLEQKESKFEQFKRQQKLHPEYAGVYADAFLTSETPLQYFRELLVFHKAARVDAVVGVLQLQPHTTLRDLRFMLKAELGISSAVEEELALYRAVLPDDIARGLMPGGDDEGAGAGAGASGGCGAGVADEASLGRGVLCPIQPTQSHKLAYTFFLQHSHALVYDRPRKPPKDPSLLRELAERARTGERLLTLDCSRGLEAQVVPVFNGADDAGLEDGAMDFTYVTHCVVNEGLRMLLGGPLRDPWPCPYAGLDADAPFEGRAYDEQGRFVHAPHTVESVFECTLANRCGMGCRNRLVQFGPRYRLEVFRCSKPHGDNAKYSKGWGVRSPDAVPEGAFLCEYIGEYISDDEAESRGIRYDDQKMSRLMDVLGDGKDSVRMCIDATRFSNLGRFLNHSCDPNVFKQRVFCDHNSRLPRIAFFATRDIAPFEELCYDYGYADVPGKTMPCLCGAKKCKKLLY